MDSGERQSPELPSEDDTPDVDVTRLLHAMAGGDPAAEAALYEVLYDELHLVASACLGQQARDFTLQATGLINEAYLRLARQDRSWGGRTHFLAVAAKAMRSALVDHARRKRRLKRGGPGSQRKSLEGIGVPGTDPDDLLDLDAALEALAQLDPQAARLVELRYFGGLSKGEAAAYLEIPERSARRKWNHAKAWLQRKLAGGRGSDGP